MIAWLLPAASGQQLPPVYFNHIGIFLDKATLADLAASPFLKDEFSAFETQTTERDGGKWTYTGMYARGTGTYLEFLPGAAKGDPPNGLMAPSSTILFGMWIDDRGQLPLIRDRLAEQTHGKPEIRIQKTFRDGRDLTWFDSVEADFPDDNAVLADSWVMAVYGDFLKQRYPDLKPEEDGTTREKQNARRYSAGKLLREITRVTMTVNKTEEDRLAREFAAYGYTIRDDGEKKIAAGPEFELEMISMPDGSPRRLAISMKLNRPKEGSQILKIGETSELRFKGDSAIWCFPKPS